MNVSLAGVSIVDPATSPRLDAYAETLMEARKKKNLTHGGAYDLLKDVNYFGTMMVKCGDADGMVSGAAHTTAATIRPGMQARQASLRCAGAPVTRLRKAHGMHPRVCPWEGQSGGCVAAFVGLCCTCMYMMHVYGCMRWVCAIVTVVSLRDFCALGCARLGAMNSGVSDEPGGGTVAGLPDMLQLLWMIRVGVCIGGAPCSCAHICLQLRSGPVLEFNCGL